MDGFVYAYLPEVGRMRGMLLGLDQDGPNNR